MLFFESAIYPFLKDRPNDFEIIVLKKYTKIVRASSDVESIWFLIDGEVTVTSSSGNGKSIVVDVIPPDNFVGHLSNIFEQNFYADSTASMKSTLVQIPIDVFFDLMKGIQFSRLYYNKVLNRLYIMYKNDLVKHLFSQQEQFANYLLECSENDVCKMESMYKTCEYLRISRRNLYNMMDSFISEGLLKKNECGHNVIVDRQKLEEKAHPVTAFLSNKV